MTGKLSLACADADAPPLFGLMDEDGARHGFEPDVANILSEYLDLSVEWVAMPFGQMLESVVTGQTDAVLCGQSITPTRSALVDFTRPYAIFDESVLMRRGEAVRDSSGLEGKRVAAIADTANMTLARTFAGAEVISFSGQADNVYQDMLDALAAGDVDAVVDDDVVFVPLGATNPLFELAFTVPTANQWAVGVARSNNKLRADIDNALASAISTGQHRSIWSRWLSDLPYPFEGAGE